MNIILASGCDKKAYKKTKSIASRYLHRINRKTWSGSITSKGVESLREELSATARKNTSVICYAIRRNGVDILWRIGNRNIFSESGEYMTNAGEQKQIVYPEYMHSVFLYSEAGGITHDIGKTTNPFQSKLRGDDVHNDYIRHEIISSIFFVELFKRFKDKSITADDIESEWNSIWKSIKKKCEGISDNYSALGSMSVEDDISKSKGLLMHLISSHHRLFDSNDGQDSHVRRIEDKKGIDYSPYKDMMLDRTTLRGIARLYNLVVNDTVINNASDSYIRGVTHFARIALIAADHFVSSRHYCDNNDPIKDDVLAANTHKCKNNCSKPFLNQPLDYHLREVSSTARRFAGYMFELLNTQFLPAIIRDNKDDYINVPERFKWQQEAINAIAAARDSNKDRPHLVYVNAGTGSGKTIAGIRIAEAASNSPSRITFISSLRTLTVQAGAEYQSFGYTPDIIIGDTTSMKIGVTESRNHNNESKSDIDIMDMDDSIEMYCKNYNLPDWTSKITGGNKNSKAIIASPLLVATADYIIHAGDPSKQRRHILSSLRCMTSDLVIDEIDSFGPKAIAALCRIVELCASYGRNVIILSATTAPPVMDALNKAFIDGQNIFDAMHKRDEKPALISIVNNYIKPLTHFVDNKKKMKYDYCNEIRAVLRQAQTYRIGKVIEMDGGSFKNSVEILFKASIEMHDIHKNQGNSIGCIRVNRSKRGFIASALMMEHAKRFMEKNPDKIVHIAYYHSNMSTASRVFLESQLETILHRERGDTKYPEKLDEHIDEQDKNKEHIFIIIATPVIDVGRDFDLDWGICEVTSVRAVVQFAGRVNRHRLINVSQPNIGIMSIPISLIGEDDIDVNLSIDSKKLSVSLIAEKIERAMDFAFGDSHTKYNEDMLKIFEGRVIDASLCLPNVTEDDKQYDSEMQQLDIKGQEDALDFNHIMPSAYYNSPKDSDGWLRATFKGKLYRKYPLRDHPHSLHLRINNEEDSKASEIVLDGYRLHTIPFPGFKKLYDPKDIMQCGWLGYKDKDDRKKMLVMLIEKYGLSETEGESLLDVHMSFIDSMSTVLYHPKLGCMKWK